MDLRGEPIGYGPGADRLRETFAAIRAKAAEMRATNQAQRGDLRPTRTDGTLTKNNLWREAGVSRATMNRAAAVLAEWDNRVGRSPASLRDQHQREEITRLRRQLRGNRQERQRLQQEVDAAATVIATLLAENAALREQLAKRPGVVVPLPLARRE